MGANARLTNSKLQPEVNTAFPAMCFQMQLAFLLVG